MANHFGAIGIHEPNEELFERIFQASKEEWRSSEIRQLRWTDPSGASMYIHVDDGGSVECITPFFVPAQGLARWRVTTSAPIDDDRCAHCGGADCSIVDEKGEVVTRTAVQWATYQRCRDWLQGPRSFELEVVLFAHHIEVFPSEKAFEASPASILGKGDDGKPLRIAPNAFMPWGMFSEGNDMGERAIARVNGSIVAVRRRINQLTHGRFWHIRVASLMGEVDVVAAAEWIEGEPKVGGHSTVDGWLVGRPAVEPRPLDA